MLRDAFDQPVTAENPDTVAALDLYSAAWLSYGNGVSLVFKAAEREPECAIVNAHAAMTHMALEAQAGYEAAQPFLRRALAHAEGASPRERAFIAATQSVSQGDVHGAVERLLAVVSASPSDIVAAKWGQYHAFNLGDAQAMRLFAEAVLPSHVATPYAYGMHAFALEQCHDLEAAEIAGRRAIDLKRAEPWAHHAIAHVMETHGRLEEGVRFMRDLAPTWDDHNIFIREHNWWHLALFHLDLDDATEVLRIYDKQLWGAWPEFSQEQIGAISALLRLELRGIDVGERWPPVAERVKARGYEHLLPFHDLHYAYALARAGDEGEAERFLDSLAQRISGMHPSAQRVWRDVALPAAKGLVAHAVQRFADAVRFLAPIMSHLQDVGGSHAQRDLFAQILIDAQWRSGDINHAARELQQRVSLRPEAIGVQRLFDAVSRRAGSAVA